MKANETLSIILVNSIIKIKDIIISINTSRQGNIPNEEFRRRCNIADLVLRSRNGWNDRVSRMAKEMLAKEIRPAEKSVRERGKDLLILLV